MLQLHRVAFSWPAGSKLELESVSGRGGSPVAGLPVHCTGESEIEPDAAARIGFPAMCWRPGGDAIFEPFQLRENTDYLIDITLPMSLVDARLLADANPAWPMSERLGTIFRRDPHKRWRESDGFTTITGGLRLKGHAGIIDLSVPLGLPCRAEVVCQKFGYHDEFRRLLSEIAGELTELLFQFDSPISGTFGFAETVGDNAAALLFQIRAIMRDDALPTAIEDLLQNFSTRLVEERSVEHAVDAHHIDFDALSGGLEASSLVAEGPLRRMFGGFSPTSFPTVTHHTTADTAENRYVVYFLDQLSELTRALHDALLAKGHTISAREAAAWLTTLQDLRSRPEWRPVGKFLRFPSNSQVLQKRHGYREILRFDLSLGLATKLQWDRGDDLADGLDGDIRPVHELYEYWCFLVLRRTLADMCQSCSTDSRSPISVSADRLHVRLVRGKQSRTAFKYTASNGATLEIHLYYNKSFRRPNRSGAGWNGSYTAQFNPDYSVEVVASSGTGRRRHWLHFDAKYRLDRFEITPAMPVDGDESSDGAYGTEMKAVHKREDLFKMHTYRDGILGSRGAYILFPGNSVGDDVPSPQLFVRHPSALGSQPLDLNIPSIGAFELSPEKAPSQLPLIASLLRHAFDDIATAQSAYVEEDGFFGAIN